ncbi:type II toxin-antitoxin system VapB family antitoxin [Nocardiopsis sp. CNR-923]|uniref:type II toxin-antitoxin system VapB family antitoxin n=1 Tax=Nocardiopsis sp. CNR-923 TaxID=1904965 RepID=UPI00117CA113|nr:type II toxin-antitoxin system VapB family antitoxin [Nocardiopsis sp. CNR-923]
MSRTNIDIDDELIAFVMERFQVRTKREAVDIALRRMAGTPLSKDFLLSLEGMGWEGDLDEMRRSGFEDENVHV